VYGRLVTAFRDIVVSDTKLTMEKGLFMGVDFCEVQTGFFLKGYVEQLYGQYTRG
jgi:hypothetical protein